MDDRQEVLDLAIVFTQPPPGSPPEILAHVALQCDALGLSHTGEVFTDPLTQHERDDLHWYLEEYWQWPYLEFAERGKRVEALLGEVGRRFYHAVFESSEAHNIVQVWQQQIGVQRRISIVSEIASILRLPWELLADSQGFLVLHADHPISMVRRLPTQGEQASLPFPFQLPLRILLVVARPEDAGFVDPRSISREMVDELQRQSEAGMIELEFLRPPTFSALRARLKDTERPIHVLHFDGHGGLDQKGQQGVLLFETNAGKQSPVKASDVAKVLSNSGVRLAVLTACQSAVNTEDDALSSVSTQLINNGMDAVIAMSSSILVTSAARYVEAFYHALAGGLPVSIAQEQARQALQKDPHRHLFSRRQDEEAAPVTLADWWVPHFYQQHPLTLHATTVRHASAPQPTSIPLRFNDAMPPEPRYRFSGRARELLQIERALLRQRLIVLSGFGGIGKTALVREAADWLTRTGLYASACFVSFEHGGDACLLLSTLGSFLGINDGSYTPQEPAAALARLLPALQARPTLVIADNLESLLPNGEAPLEREAREQLWYVLRNLVRLGAGVLLTTRASLKSEDQLAPGTHVAAFPLGGLLPQDAYDLATRLLEELGIPRIRAPYAALRDLLAQLDHHPLAIQLVLPALRERALDTIRADFAALLPTFTDDHSEGSNHSLSASLDYSLRRLSDTQRALLPRLTLFEGGTGEDNLLVITQIPEADWAILRPAMEESALLTVEPVAGAVPFLHFHPVLTPFLRSQPGADDPALRERFASRYAAVAGYLYMMAIQYPQVAYALVQQELPNLRRTLAHLLEVGDLEAATALAEHLARFLTAFGRWRERDDLRQRVAEGLAAQQQPTRTTDAGALSHAEYLQEIGLGQDEWERGNLRAASTRVTRLLARIEAQPEGTLLGQGSYEHCITLTQLAHCLEAGHNLITAEGYLRKAFSVINALLQQEPESKQINHQRGYLLSDLGNVLRKQGKYTEAQDAYKKSLEVGVQLDDPRMQMVVIEALGSLALSQRDYTEAQSRYAAAQQASHSLGEPMSEATAWYQLGRVAGEQENWPEAERCYRESLTITERLGIAATTINTAMICNELAIVAQETGRTAEAEGWYRRTLANPNNLDPGHLNNFATLLVDEVQAGRSSPMRLAEAKRYAEQALALKETREEAEIWLTFSLLARIADLEGKSRVAHHYRRLGRETFAAFVGNRSELDRHMRPIITAIAAGARGHGAVQQAVEAALPEMEVNGWQIATATRRIWAGERDWHALTEELNRDSALLILRVLETLAVSEEARAQSSPEAILATLPTLVLTALLQRDTAAFAQALAALASAEQQRALAILQTWLQLAEEGEPEQGE